MQIQLPFAPQPVAQPQASEPTATPGAPGGGFAQLMANTRGERETPPPRDAARSSDSSDPSEAADTEDAATTPASPRPDESRAARLRNAARPVPAPQHEARHAAKPSESTDETKQRADSPAPGRDAVAADPALTQWLAQLHLPPADAAAPKAAAPAVATAPDADAAQAAALTRNGVVGLDSAGAGTGPTAAAARSGERAGAGREAAPAALASATRFAEETTAAAAPTEHEPVTPPAAQGFALPAGFEAAQAAAAGRTDAPPPAATDASTTQAVAVPIDSPDFAQAFGVQVSVLARDGVHEAQLQLNPAEMGPVSVQIAMDGERAHIDFGAQAAATRAAIEASLPELAAALRDAGLTLSGGGVSQHTPGRGDAQRGASPDEARSSTRERAGAVAGTNSRPAWRGRVSPGGVDLYA